MPKSLVGRQLGDYILEQELGRGSMGAVYRAHHVSDAQTPYAVKVLLETLASDVSFITRFIREARVISTLHHPNIIRVYDTGHQGEHIFFAMEYFEGSTVAHLLRERKRLAAPQVIEIAAQAADALDYAHTHGKVIHRDIKPENLLVDRWFRVKLLDFGLARVDGTQRITQAGTVVGSLYYVSPEQLREQPMDGRADVYALGISMYELLTGRRPYHGTTLPEMTEAILHGRAQSPRQLESSVPADLNDIVLRAMARDLDQRIPTAGALRDELRALQVAPRPGQEVSPPFRLTPIPALPGERVPLLGYELPGTAAGGKAVDIADEPTRAHQAPATPRTFGPRPILRTPTLQPLPQRRPSDG